MCGRCEGEPYRGVYSLFNGELQAKNEFADRKDWAVVSPRVIIYLGKSVFEKAENPLLRTCEEGAASLTVNEWTALEALSKTLGRPMLGKP